MKSFKLYTSEHHEKPIEAPIRVFPSSLDLFIQVDLETSQIYVVDTLSGERFDVFHCPSEADGVTIDESSMSSLTLSVFDSMTDASGFVDFYRILTSHFTGRVPALRPLSRSKSGRPSPRQRMESADIDPLMSGPEDSLVMEYPGG